MAGAERTGALSVAPGSAPSEDSVREAMAILLANQARLIVAEFPATPATGGVERVLREAGFTDESEVADYYKDGTAMRILALRPTTESR